MRSILQQMMRYVWVAAFSAITLCASPLFASSPPQSDTILVAATNGGVVAFTLSLASYSFGTVNANGAANVAGTQALTGTTNASGAVYTATTALTWRASSSPAATIYVYNGSTSSVI